MPRGVPRLGATVGNPTPTDSVVEDLSHAPQAEVLGELKVQGPKSATWDDADLQVQIAMEEGPPPWVLAGVENPGDARNFIDCPEDWVLYWINTRLLDQVGWRGWMSVRASDSRVKVKVPAMVTPDGMIRRGGPNGDILSYMPRHWYEEKWKLWDRQTALKTQSSLDRMTSLKEEFRRGRFGPNITLESAVHPTHTMADGRSMTDP